MNYCDLVIFPSLTGDRIHFFLPAYSNSHYKVISKEPTKKSSLSEERIRILEEMGFRWSIQDSLWDVSVYAVISLLIDSTQSAGHNTEIAGRRYYVVASTWISIV